MTFKYTSQELHTSLSASMHFNKLLMNFMCTHNMKPFIFLRMTAFNPSHLACDSTLNKKSGIASAN